MARSFMGTFVCLFLATLSFSAHSLECHLNNQRGITEDFEDIGEIKIPIDLPVGSRIWTSKLMTRTVACWAESFVTWGEPVYIYANPDNQNTYEIGFGLIYNGRDLGILSNRQKTEMFRYPLNGRPPITNKINYQVYMEVIRPLYLFRLRFERPVFQLDGLGNINPNPGKNYRYILRGSVQVTSCKAIISAPQSLDFGPVGSWEGPGNGGPLAIRSFTIGVNKTNCGASEDFTLETIFDTRTSDMSLPSRTQPPGTISTLMDLGNGLGLTLQDSDGKSISFNTPQTFANMKNSVWVSRRYTATLVAKGKAKEGPFNRPLILLINYL